MANKGRNLRSNSASSSLTRNAPVNQQHHESRLSFREQPQIDTWFGSPGATAGIRSVQNGAVFELKGIMLDVQSSMRNIETKFSHFEQSLKDVTDTSIGLLESNREMNESIVDLNGKVDSLEENEG